MRDYSDIPAMNVELMGDVLTWATADECAIQELKEKFPEWGEWKQGRWAEEARNGICQTSYCIAGQAAHQVGYMPILESVYGNEDRTILQATDCAPRKFAGLDEKGKPKFIPDPEAPARHISTVGREALGITSYEADALFSGENDLGTVVAMALGFARVRGVFDELYRALPAEAIGAVEDMYGDGDGRFALAIEKALSDWGFSADYLEAATGVPIDSIMKQRLRRIVDDVNERGEIEYEEYDRLIEWLDS